MGAGLMAWARCCSSDDEDISRLQLNHLRNTTSNIWEIHVAVTGKCTFVIWEVIIIKRLLVRRWRYFTPLAKPPHTVPNRSLKCDQYCMSHIELQAQYRILSHTWYWFFLLHNEQIVHWCVQRWRYFTPWAKPHSATHTTHMATTWELRFIFYFHHYVC